MAWDFETEPEFQEKLDWMDDFVREEVEPMDLVWTGSKDVFDTKNEQTRRVIAPLQEEVKKRDLWASHMGPELGGNGFGQLKLALMNEILGRSSWAPRVFGCQARILEMRRSSPTTGPRIKRTATCRRCSRD